MVSFYRAIHAARLVQIEGSCSFLSATARRKKSKKSLSSDWAENLAESNKGLLLRPGAMAEGVERAAKHRMGPVSFHMTILQPLEDLESKNTETNESVTFHFCQGSVEVVENLRTWFHLDVLVAERNLSVALNLFCIPREKSRASGINRASFLTFELSVAVTRQPQRFLVFSVCICEQEF